MVAVIVAVLLGVFVGLAVRPLLDAYLSFKTARFYAEYVPPSERESLEHDDRSDVR